MSAPDSSAPARPPRPAEDVGGFLTGLFGLVGKVAVVTGGGSGLGGAFAEGLAAAGASVVLFDVSEAGMAAVPSAAGAVRVDVTSKGSVTEAVAGVVARHGGVDILVNSAGIARRHPAEEFP